MHKKEQQKVAWPNRTILCDRVEATIESSKSTDVGIYYGLSFLWNAESPKNLQQTKAAKVGNSESTGDSDKFPDAL